MEAKKSFTEAFTLGSRDNLSEEVDPSMLTTYLETCMKLLHDSKAMKGLQELINKCDGKEIDPEGHHVVMNIGKHKRRTRCEMRFTVKIGDYEMDQVLLDLG